MPSGLFVLTAKSISKLIEAVHHASNICCNFHKGYYRWILIITTTEEALAVYFLPSFGYHLFNMLLCFSLWNISFSHVTQDWRRSIPSLFLCLQLISNNINKLITWLCFNMADIQYRQNLPLKFPSRCRVGLWQICCRQGHGFRLKSRPFCLQHHAPQKALSGQKSQSLLTKPTRCSDTLEGKGYVLHYTTWLPVIGPYKILTTENNIISM